MSTLITQAKLLINNKKGVTQVVETEEQRKQVRYLYIVHFLSTVSISIVSALLAIFTEVAQVGEGTVWRTTEALPDFKFAAIVLSSIPWGLLSNKMGRKKVLIFNLLGSALSIGLFGYCKTIDYATYLSFLIGAFSCSIILVKTMMTESLLKLHRAYHLTCLVVITSIAYKIGYDIGAPFIPSLSDSSKLFKFKIPKTELPYKIPCLIGTIASIIAAIISHFCLDETLGNKINEDTNNSTNSLAKQPKTLPDSELTTELGLTISKDSKYIFNGLGNVTFVFSGFTTIVRDWATNEVSNGGLNLKLEHFNMTIEANSFITALSVMLLYPSLHRNYGSYKLYKSIFLPTGVIFTISSILRLIAKTGNSSVVLSLFAVIFSVLTILHIIQEISLDLLLIDSSKLTNNLATLFGISNVIANILNCQILFNLLFNLSTDEALPFPLKFNLYWALLGLASFIGYRFCSKKTLIKK
jgi:MFS family permease